MLILPEEQFSKSIRALLEAANVGARWTELQLREAAAGILPNLDPREAMIALLDVAQALNIAGLFDRLGPGRTRCCWPLSQRPPADVDAGYWVSGQAEAWREMAWAVAVTTIRDDHAARADAQEVA